MGTDMHGLWVSDGMDNGAATDVYVALMHVEVPLRAGPNAPVGHR